MRENERIFSKERTAHNNWMAVLREAENLVREDTLLMKKAKAGVFLKDRGLPMEVLGRLYAEYCALINKLYTVYVFNEQIQKLPYILNMAKVFSMRMFELRQEMLDHVVSDYLYVDTALIQRHKQPYDIQFVVPFHYPLELREDSVERFLQKVWRHSMLSFEGGLPSRKELSVTIFSPKLEESGIDLEKFQYATLIQSHERYRQFNVQLNRKNVRLISFVRSVKNPVKKPGADLCVRASSLIQKILRAFLESKREALKEYKRDVLLGIQPPRRDETYIKPVDRQRKDMHAMLLHKKKQYKHYLEEFDKQQTKLRWMYSERLQDEIREHVREWFYTWYKSDLRFPPFPPAFRTGTIMVLKEEYPTIAEFIEKEAAEIAAKKGKTKEQLAKDKEDAKEAKILAEMVEKERKKREKEAIFKQRCNPKADVGYKVKVSAIEADIIKTLIDYKHPWRDLDKYDQAPDFTRNVVFGFFQYFITEEVMATLHEELRYVVDEFMKLELKLLTKALKHLYKRCNWKYPKEYKTPRPPRVKRVKIVKLNDANKVKFRDLFEAGVLQRHNSHHISDIMGDFNYHAYEYNIKDPDPTFPLPEIGDIRNRLTMSCVLGAMPTSGAPRCRSVLLVGPPQCGKTFMVECVCNEMNAVMLNLSPEYFTSRFNRPKKVLHSIINAAKLLQPAVIFVKNIERVFAKKLPPDEKKLRPGGLKRLLAPILKSISPQDKIIFIATVSETWITKPKPIMKLFHEVIPVPLMQYDSIRMMLDEKLKSYQSVDRYLNVQPLAKVLKGYSYGFVTKIIESVLTAERRARLYSDPLRLEEIYEPVILSGEEPWSEENYDQCYTQWVVKNTHLGAAREEYAEINKKRAEVYNKLKQDEEKKKKAAEKKEKKEKEQ